MVKRGQKKGLKEEKKNAIKNFLDHVRSQLLEYETRVSSMGEEACDKIRKMYADKLKSLPENVRNMTLAEYLAEEDKQMNQDDDIDKKTYRSEYERTKLMSEKKKNLKSRREERKRSMSVNTTYSTVSAKMSEKTFSRIMSESSLLTPLSKRSVAPAFAVTPKFNPRVPVNQRYLRRPKPGEMVMSVSGSPLQNTEDIPDRPAISLPLGNGKVLKITEDTDIQQLESDIARVLSDDTKQTLENLRTKLNQLV